MQKLNDEEWKKYNEGWEKYAYNEYVSNMISVRRFIGDLRHPE